MNISIRQENESDFYHVNHVIKSAFEKVEISDQSEHLLVHRLRGSKSFIPELSLVAIDGEKIVGHILLTPVNIKNEHLSFFSLALAPVSVKPEMQLKGIGSLLIQKAHKVARDLGYTSIVLIGHKDYYPKFGYKKANDFDIRFPFEVQIENGFVIELVKNSLKGVNGVVMYPSAFFE